MDEVPAQVGGSPAASRTSRQPGERGDGQRDDQSEPCAPRAPRNESNRFCFWIIHDFFFLFCVCFFVTVVRRKGGDLSYPYRGVNLKINRVLKTQVKEITQNSLSVFDPMSAGKADDGSARELGVSSLHFLV